MDNVNTLLNHVDSGFLTLPKFQRGYVWSREQIRKLFHSLYRKHPVGGLILWTTQSEGVDPRGGGNLPPGVVNLLLDGQQRVTSLYGVIRGEAPRFFDGDSGKFNGLHFNVSTEEFEFYQPVKMRGDSRWINVTELMKAGNQGIGVYFERFKDDPACADYAIEYFSRLNQLLGIRETEIPQQSITGSKELDEIVEIFNEVNTGGTKLSKGDLALARICADWPEARDVMKSAIERWAKDGEGYDFTLDWLLRSVNTVLTNNAEFRNLQDRTSEEIQGAMNRTVKHIDTWLNQVSDRLGLDHDRVLFGRYAFPVLARYTEKYGGQLSAAETDKLLFWYAQSGMWGRFSSASETTMNQDLRAIDREGNPIDNLLDALRLWRGSLLVEAGNFDASTLGARFYPILYMLTRVGEARDLCKNLALKATMLGSMSRLEVHHIFPKSRLYEAGFDRYDINALANFALLTKECNLEIGNRLPKEYLPYYEEKNPGVLKSQWIPNDPRLWEIENYPEFLDARRELLATATNELMGSLLHGEDRWLSGRTVSAKVDEIPALSGNIVDPDEEAELEAINSWITTKGLAPGVIAFDYADPTSGEQLAVFDIAWPEGLQAGLSGPVVVLLNESASVQSLASAAGFRYFTNVDTFKTYVLGEILHEEPIAS